MSGKRVLVLYALLVGCFAVVLCRLYWLCSNPLYAARAAAQSVVTLSFPARRGNFYDHQGRLLTGGSSRWMALCVPGEESYAKLFSDTDAAGQAELYRRRNAAVPFLLEVERDVSALGVACWPVARRYGAASLAAQLVGYLDGEGRGAAGLEAALDAELSGSGQADSLTCIINAQGRLRSTPERTPADSGAVGVRLTLSRDIQQAVEAVAAQTMEQGCILVLETATGRLRAAASVPGYDPEQVADSLDAPGSPLLERAFVAYAVGSVFKPVLAAAALESGQTDLVYTCPGWCAVDGQAFRCAGGAAHGEVDLAAALEKSCNGYFIRLGQLLGPETICAMARRLGFGQAAVLAGRMQSAAGNLPRPENLTSSGACANFSFGQGELLATPLQIAGMMNTIACGGVFHTPILVECTLDETSGEELTTLAHPRASRGMKQTTAQVLQTLLAGVVEQGTGQEAASLGQSAAGKTGTAQTGQFQNGAELKNFWFAGFFPAKEPRYTIVVLQDAQQSPAVSSAAVFARTAAGLEAFLP